MKIPATLRGKRVLLPLVSLLLVLAATATAVFRSDASRIIVYNQTGMVIPALKVEASGQLRVFRNLGDAESFRWTLKPTGEAGEIRLETATEPTWQWRGAPIEPRGGYRVTLRLWPDGQVEAHTQISLWQRFLWGAPDINE